MLRTEREKAIIAEILTSKLTLADDTKKQRKYLLGFSLLIIAITWIGIVPTKLTALGIEFTQVEQRILLMILGLINFYYFTGFIIYGIKDYYIWKSLENYFYITDMTVMLNSIKNDIADKVKEDPELTRSIVKEQSLKSMPDINVIEYLYDKKKEIIMGYVKLRKIQNYIFFVYNLLLPIFLTVISNYLLIRKLIVMP